MKIRISYQRRLPRSGFTLMEMMVVVAIIVALAGIGIFFLAPQADEGTKVKVKADIKSLTQAVTTYKVNHAGAWPQSLEVLLVKDESGFGPYVRSPEDLQDPWGHIYNYDPSGSNNGGLQPDIWCDTPLRVKVCNWTNKWLPY